MNNDKDLSGQGHSESKESQSEIEWLLLDEAREASFFRAFIGWLVLIAIGIGITAFWWGLFKLLRIL